MTYRVRFRMFDGADEGEEVIEANSPTEAIVKFRHAQGGHAVSDGHERVLSVSADDQPDALTW